MMRWLTLREIDEAAGAAKGAAFRAFKRFESKLAEGRDFRLLDATADAAEIAALGERAYRSSHNVLVFSEKTAALLRGEMR
jgi:hypothetical protein